MQVLARDVWYAGSQLPVKTATLRDENGDPIPYAGTETVEFVARAEYGANLFRKAAAWVNAASGQIKFVPDSSTVPLDAPLGVYDLFWAITAAGKTEFIPAGQMELQPAAVAGTAEAVAPAPWALVTVERVQQDMGVPGQRTILRDVLQRRVNAVSRMVILEAEQEFRPLTAETTRVFPVGRDGIVDFAGAILQPTPAPTILRNVESGPGTAVTATSYQLRPFDAAVHGGHSHLYLLRGSGYRDPSTGAVGLVSVDGTWGWADVPDDIAELTSQVVVEWTARREFLQNPNLPEPDDTTGTLPPNAGLPQWARRYLQTHYRPLPA